MSYNSTAFAGLVSTGTPVSFNGGTEWIQLSTTTTGVEDGPRSATFTYDDTCLGAVASGLNYTLATHAGALVQLVFAPPALTGSLESLAVSMVGFGAIDVVDDAASTSAGSIITLGSELPLDPTTGYGGYLFLRPTPLPNTWAGKDMSNAAIRTLWTAAEVGVITTTIGVYDVDIRLPFNGEAKGWAT